ncbi:MAG: hypothetical protein MSS83_05435 [Methanobrevibacter sp.]|uniref:hypothetical protein n=1 Tax=Methanobrevibacter sp. TaxID=66852 RepID=UPI0031F5623B|nr:hypothetical protein [Methanobrevibacter sp.]
MDLIFKRYSSPYLIIDQMILYESFSEFVDTIWDNNNEEKLYDLYLSYNPFNKVDFPEFKELAISRPEDDTKSLETTVKNSYEMLNGFNPK